MRQEKVDIDWGEAREGGKRMMMMMQSGSQTDRKCKNVSQIHFYVSVHLFHSLSVPGP